MVRPSLVPHRIIFNTDDQQVDDLARYCREKKMTRAEAIRSLLRTALIADAQKTQYVEIQKYGGGGARGVGRDQAMAVEVTHIGGGHFPKPGTGGHGRSD